MKNKARYLIAATLILSALVAVVIALQSQPTGQPKGSTPARATFAQVPLSFEQNVGQTDERVRYVARGIGYTIFLTETEAVISLRDRQGVSGVLRLKPAWASDEGRLVAGDLQSGSSNYFIGNDPSKWHTNVPAFSSVRYVDVYPGIDLVYHGDQRQLEYDFVVAPGVDPSAIELACEGAEKTNVDASGDLVLAIGEREVRFRKPLVYQESDGVRQEIAARFVLNGNNRAGFEIAAYDNTKPLVIDPVLLYSTYLGGSGNEDGQAIAVDALGNAYVTGATNSFNFPVTPGAAQPSQPSDTANSNPSVYVTKISPSGTTIIYSTYLGGSCTDIGYGIAVDAAGE